MICCGEKETNKKSGVFEKRDAGSLYKTASVMIACVALLLGNVLPVLNIFAYAMLICAFCVHVIHTRTIGKKSAAILLFGLLIAGINVIFNECGCFDFVKNFYTLFIVQYFMRGTSIDGDEKLLTVFEVAINLCLSATLIYSMPSGWNFSDAISFDFWDKNMIGIVSMIMLFVSLKTKHYYWTIMNAVYIIATGSRMLLIADVMLVLCELVGKTKRYKSISTWIKKHGNMRAIYLSAFIIPTIIVAGLSYYMSYNMSKTSITDYKESFNDTSNAVRARSNLYAINTMTSDKKFVLFGYDNNIREKIGGGTIEKHKTYLGFRVVQPHNLVLNLVMRYGLLAAIMYLWIVALLIMDKTKRENISLLIVYIFCNMFLPLLFSGVYLPLIAIALSIKDRKR